MPYNITLSKLIQFLELKLRIISDGPMGFIGHINPSPPSPSSKTS